MSKSVYILLFIACVGLTTACGRRTSNTPIHTIPNEALSITGSATFTTQNLKLAAKLALRIRHDSLIWLSIRHPLGIELARGTATQEKIQAIAYLQQLYFEYPYTRVASQIGIPLQYAWIERLLLGKPLLAAEAYTQTADSDDEHLHLQADISSIHISHWQTREKSQLIKQLITTPHGGQLQVSYTYPPPSTTPTHTAYPTRVNIRFAGKLAHKNFQDDMALELIYKKITPSSVTDVDFPFDIPKTYEKK